LINEKTFYDDFWQNKPILTHEELLMRLVDLEPLFAKNHLARQPSKTKTTSLFLVLMS